MKYLFFLFPILALSQQPDKIKHYVAGAAISSTTYALVYKKSHNHKKAFWFSMATGIIAGVGKELYDPVFDKKDLAATTLGSFSVNLTIQLFKHDSINH